MSSGIRERYSELSPRLLEEWNSKKNGDLDQLRIKPGSDKVVWWLCSKGHEWEAAIKDRTRGRGCPYCAHRKASSDYNLAVLHLQLAEEWHPTKNGRHKPSDFLPFSNRKVWWICERGHEWEQVIASRTAGRSCPCCSGKRVCKDNNLEVKHPVLAKEWHPTMNGKLRPDQFLPGSGRSVWWRCEHGHEWKSRIAHRSSGSGCPFCSGQKATADNNLAERFPELIVEWHPTKNGDLSPDTLLPFTNLKIWWQCRRGHEWEASVNSRTNMRSGCPYCSGNSAGEDNNLEALNPQLAREWHPTKNKDLRPKHVTPGSNKKVWWKCEHGHEWPARVCNRAKGVGCPYCSGRRATKDHNLSVKVPSVALQWHPERNGSHRPDEFAPSSDVKVWWKCGRGHEWEATISSRTRGHGCPYCRPQTSLQEIRLFCELKSIFGEVEWIKRIDGIQCDVFLSNYGVAVEYDGVFWHRDKVRQDKKKERKLVERGITVFRVRENGLRALSDRDVVLTPREGGISFVKKLLLKIRENLDIEPGDLLNVENYLTRRRFASGTEFRRMVSTLPAPPPEYSFAGKHPEIAREWHPKKNTPLKPEMFTAGSGRKVWWVCRKGHEWRAAIHSRTKGHGCPYCAGLKSSPASSLAAKYPGVAAQWHPVKNGRLVPNQVPPKSHKKVWWQCEEGHEWQAAISSRTAGSGCPYCRGLKADEEDSISAHFPQIAASFNAAKNGTLKPTDLSPKSNRTVWWQCDKGHEWQATVSSRVNGSGCPCCSGRQPSPDENPALRFADIAKEWHPSRNGLLNPKDVKPFSGRKVWWKCERGHEWEAVIGSRTAGNDCPYCSGRKPSEDHNLEAAFPALAKEWHPTKNMDLLPKHVTRGSDKIVWWLCDNGHEWQARVSSRANGSGCPYCSGRQATPEDNLTLRFPAIAKQWHPWRNGLLRPQDVKAFSDRKVWWQCDRGHEWEAVIGSRAAGNGCPYCSGRKPSKEHSLKTAFPDIAMEWHPTRNGNVHPSAVTPSSGRRFWWKCAQGHEWKATVGSRTSGARCPYCSGNRPTEDRNLAVMFPSVAREWHPTKNGELRPHMFLPFSGKVMWWRCAEGHEWQAKIQERSRGARCPTCQKTG